MVKNKLVLSNKKIVDSSVIISCSYDSCVNSSTNFRLGDATADSLEVELRGPVVPSPGEEFKYYRNDVLMGVFVTQESTRLTKTTYKVVAYDHLMLLERDVAPLLTEIRPNFPMSLMDLTNSICDYCLIPRPEAFPHSEFVVNEITSDSVSGRQIIMWVAEIAACFCYADVNGALAFGIYRRRTDIGIAAGGEVPQKPKPRAKIPVYADSVPIDVEPVHKIARVRIAQSENDIGIVYPEKVEGNTYTIMHNPLASGLTPEMQSEIAQWVYAYLWDVEYTPISWDSPDTEIVHPGDIVDVYTPDGPRIAYIMRVERDARGCRCSCTGDPEQGSAPSEASKKYTNLYGKMFEIDNSIAGLTTRATEIERTANATSEKVTELSQTAEGLQTSVSRIDKTATDAAEAVSAVSQKADSISAEVSKKVSSDTGHWNTFGYEMTADRWEVRANNVVLLKLTQADGLELNGKITTASGKIGGWSIDSSSIFYQDPSNDKNLVLSINGGLYGGISGKEWHIRQDGSALFNSAEIHGDIYAENGFFHGTVYAKGISYGGSGGYVSGKCLSNNSVTTVETSTGINADLGFAEFSDDVFNERKTAKSVLATAVKATAVHCTNYWSGKHLLKEKSATIGGTTINYMSWS